MTENERPVQPADTASDPSWPVDQQEHVRERPGGLLSRVDGHLVMYHEPGALHAEQYRACRTNLMAINRSGAPWAIVVTSSQRGEGKSITAANLAACLAEAPGAKVCLLDLDSRAPSLGRILGVDMDQGVTELIKGDVSLSQVRVPTVIPNMDVICAGAEPDNPAELLGSEQFVNLITELKRRYSWIILDSPPVNPWTDACVVSALVNGALVVVRLQEAPREKVNRSLDLIRSAGGQVLGTFLTGLTVDRDDPGRYSEADEESRAEAASPDGETAETSKNLAKAEQSLRKQERAFLKSQSKKRKREDDEDTLV
ncbi:MAG: CpsD/CapB family tyrosine-protein kinase [Planctomycetota bacterium]|nr:CpsD/CapB family tyrosine-protein kinase [Planctomycetota bacterium]